MRDLWKATYESLEGKVNKPFTDFAVKHARFVFVMLVLTWSVVGSVVWHERDYIVSKISTIEYKKVPEEASAIGGLEEEMSLNGLWFLNNEDATLMVDGFIELDENYGSARFDYSEEVPFLKNDFAFVSRGTNGMNLQFSRTTLYQVDIGDNSYEHLGFKSMGTDLQWRTYERKNFENCKYSVGDTITFNVNENYIETKNEYVVELTFLCGEERDIFRFVFEPVQNFKELRKFYFALIDPEGENNTSIYFISPAIADRID